MEDNESAFSKLLSELGSIASTIWMRVYAIVMALICILVLVVLSWVIFLVVSDI